MAIGTSIVGKWNVFVDWGCNGGPVSAGVITFAANGSWTYAGGGGRWIQIEGMCFFNFSNAAGLVYTANVTRNALLGIMGYAVAGPNPGSGCWWATGADPAHTLAADVAAAKTDKDHDVLIEPRPK